MLDNFDHIKAYWIMLTPSIAQIALRFGANDLDGTVVEEKIYHDAGANTSEFTPRGELERLIRAAGRVPVERDTLYRPVDRSKMPPNRAAHTPGLSFTFPQRLRKLASSLLGESAKRRWCSPSTNVEGN